MWWWIDSNNSDTDSNDGTDPDRYNSTYFGTSSDRYGKDR
jgi:hypothetical protein